MARQVGERGLVVLSDINEAMLDAGRDRLLDRGLVRQRALRRSPMPSACRSPTTSFDCVTIGFGLRNVTDKPRGARLDASRAAPGGRLLVLEFSQARRAGPEAASTTLYSFSVLPRLGKLVAGDCGQLPLPRRIDPHASRTRRRCAGMMQRGRLRALRLLQPDRRHRRAARGLPATDMLLERLAEMLNRNVGDSRPRPGAGSPARRPRDVALRPSRARRSPSCFPRRRPDARSRSTSRHDGHRGR